MENNSMILAKDRYYSLDTYQTQVNNNVLVVGTSGAGKTRSIVIPNLLLATGSYVITDPKGNLYRKYKKYLKEKGYAVKKLDFTDPGHSSQYNFFNYIEDTQDIVKLSHMLIYRKESSGRKMDPFWDEASQLLLQSLIAYLIETKPLEERTFHNVFKLIALCQIDENDASTRTSLDSLFYELERQHQESYAVSTYKKFRIAAGRTLRSILISLNARLGQYDTPEINKMTSRDSLDITSIGKQKTALFVVVSDTDRSLDGLINIFFGQAMSELCRYADRHCKDQRLPIPIRFFQDDFCTNCTIADFPRMIASFRSRGIATLLSIQAESQLTEIYNYDAKTVVGCCDTYVYLGGNDIETAKAVSERCNVPVQKILNMPIGTNWIFRRGEIPYNGYNVDLEDFCKELQEFESSLEER